MLIVGEPIVGKSRLTAALAESIGGEPHKRLRYFASPHHQDSALHPFIIQPERAAGFARDETPEARLGKLEALIAGGAGEPDEITLIGELLSQPKCRSRARSEPAAQTRKAAWRAVATAGGAHQEPPGADGLREDGTGSTYFARPDRSDSR